MILAATQQIRFLIEIHCPFEDLHGILLIGLAVKALPTSGTITSTQQSTQYIEFKEFGLNKFSATYLV